MVLKDKVKLNKKLSTYFINQYYKPDIKYSLADRLNKFATSSIDLSDGLISDLEKLTNKQKNTYQLYFDKIPISKNLNSVINSKSLSKKNFISKGDDYQILFTAKTKSRLKIYKLSKKLKLKISRIGYITKNMNVFFEINGKKFKTRATNLGYTHIF